MHIPFSTCFIVPWMASLPLTHAMSSLSPIKAMMTVKRTIFLQQMSLVGFSSMFGGIPSQVTSSFSSSSPQDSSIGEQITSDSRMKSIDIPIAYRPMELYIEGVTIPVAMWYPIGKKDVGGGGGDYAIDDKGSSKNNRGIQSKNSNLTPVSYDHKISIRRIGQLLARWEFIPGFVEQGFALKPTVSSILDGALYPLPTSVPVVLLAHGYLGSRFDLSHLAEALAREGFLCLSAEYPESLAASYETGSLDRLRITESLLQTLQSTWNIQPTSFAIVGHSLGTGTALSIGDSTWARVCIAGFPRRPENGRKVTTDALFVMSMNDGAVSPKRFGGMDGIPKDISIITASNREELQLTLSQRLSDTIPLPPRLAIVFDGPDAPNHISFLTDEVNNAMIRMLSPLLPIAQAMNIPVLDFDKYKLSRDSRATGEIYIPAVIRYIKQQLNL